MLIKSESKIKINRNQSGFFERIFDYALKDMKTGTLNVYYNNTLYKQYGQENEKPPAEIILKNKDFFKKCALYGDIGFAESYMNFDFETPDLYRLLDWFIENSENSPTLGISRNEKIFINILKLLNRFIHKSRKNSIRNARKNISYHYDLSNDFYKTMLDETMAYSSGIFVKNENLEQSQIQKFERICRKLNLRPGLRILEIGSGWGGFAIYAARNYDCYITTITISEEQFRYTTNEVKKNGLEDKIEILFLDYRHLSPDIHGKYDRIVSIEMVEALGIEYFDMYFKKIQQMLKDDGLVILQYIHYPEAHYENYVHSVDFIQKYIFPGGLLLSHYEVMKSLHRVTELNLYHLETFGLSYAKTLRNWKENFIKNLNQIKNLGFNETFIRMWYYYLTYCEVGFQSRYINVCQILLSKSRNPNLVDFI